MTAIQRSLLRRLGRSRDSLEDLLPNASLAPAREAVIDCLVRAIVFRTILPAAADLKHVHDTAQNAAIILTLRPRLIGRQIRNDLRPLIIVEPE